MKFVFDASSIIILNQTEGFPLINAILNRLDASIVLLDQVENELLSVSKDNLYLIDKLDRLNFTPTRNSLAEFGNGERSVLEFMIQQNNELSEEYICVIDDLKARSYAKELNIPFVGLLGLTGIGYEICLINTRRELLDLWNKWKKLRFRLPKLAELNIFCKSLKKA